MWPLVTEKNESHSVSKCADWKIMIAIRKFLFCCFLFCVLFYSSFSIFLSCIIWSCGAIFYSCSDPHTFFLKCAILTFFFSFMVFTYLVVMAFQKCKMFRLCEAKCSCMLLAQQLWFMNRCLSVLQSHENEHFLRSWRAH